MIIHSIRLRMSMSYLIEGDGGLYLVDAGLKGEENKILNKLRVLQRSDLVLVYITHAHLDHYGCAAALRRITGARIAIHHADAGVMLRGQTKLGSPRNLGRIMKALLPIANPILRPEPVSSDIQVEDGDSLGNYGLAAKVLHTPGHTLGSTTLLLENDIAFVGDLVTNSGRARPQRYFAEDWVLLRQSIDRLKHFKPRLLYTGHGHAPIQSGDFINL